MKYKVPHKTSPPCFKTRPEKPIQFFLYINDNEYLMKIFDL